MIKHIVCFKLKENSESAKKEAKDILMSMDGKIPEIKAIEVGMDFLCSEKSYDIILQVVFENRESLDIYQNDKYHCEVVKSYVRANASSSIVIDYEIWYKKQGKNNKEKW